MAEKNSTPPSPEQIRRGRKIALLLFAVGFGPMLLATVMYYTGWFNPTDYSNNGQLIQPAVPVAQLGLISANGSPLAARFGPERENAEWLMLVAAQDCKADCEKLLYLARQVNIALGKNADRMNRAAYLEQMPAELQARWPSEYATMERLTSDGQAPAWSSEVRPNRAPVLLLVDPFGNVMMRYDSRHSGKDMLKDLKHLMKLSQIG
ncbi:hypothetical protein [Marinobacter caseinilyticus]|uniref:hypothetical protein n=1 Tax=Marinobacter caseinilyticus TaxID=2692195 RepID=UPI001409785A|nr:hypothetical protein [Marinobacter caseinilyticus]